MRRSLTKTQPEIDRDLYLSQTKTIECQDFLLKNKQFIKGALAGRHPQCKNRLTLGEWNIEDFSEEQLVFYKEGKDTYCFTTNDIMLLFEMNPFSKKEFTPEFQETIEKLQNGYKSDISVYPLEHAIELLSGNPEYCPQGALLTDPRIKYLMTDLPVTLKEVHQLPPIQYFPGQYLSEYILEKLPILVDLYKTNYHEIVFVYRVLLNTPETTESKIESKSIIEMTEIFNSTHKETDSVIPKFNNVKDGNELLFLKQYMEGFPPDLNHPGFELLRKRNIKVNRPIRVYRGLKWFSGDVEDFTKVVTGKDIGDVFQLSSRGKLASWSTNLCVSESFATGEDSYGVVVSTILQPKDIFVDTRLFTYEFKKDMYWGIQNEIISLPFDEKNKPKIFTVRIIKFVSGIWNRIDRLSIIYPKKYDTITANTLMD